MEFEKQSIEDLILIKPQVFGDDRGFFMEGYNKKIFTENGIDVEFVQDNYSRSQKGVLRGLHFQLPPFAQDKLVRVTRGEVIDVAVDIRKDSPTFGKYVKVLLTEENKHAFFIPQGFAHAFLVVSEFADFTYKVSNFYSKEHDRGLIWNDLEIAIDWEIDEPLLSEKDANQPTLKGLIEKEETF